MIPDGQVTGGHQKTRSDLLRQYVRLQRELVEADPASSAYQGIIRAFRHMGHALLSVGLEDDLDRLLRMRVLDGGLDAPVPRDQRVIPKLHIIERRAL